MLGSLNKLNKPLPTKKLKKLEWDLFMELKENILLYIQKKKKILLNGFNLDKEILNGGNLKIFSIEKYYQIENGT